MKRIKKYEEFINESDYYEVDYGLIPDNILEHWLYHYDLWCKENGQLPEYDSVEELIGNGSGIDHVYYHADIYAKKHGFELDGHEYMEGGEEMEESLLTEGESVDVERLAHGLKYRNETFPGFNHPKKYEGKGKHKYRVLAREGDKVKVINFGKSGEEKKSITKLNKKYWENQTTWR
jgi:hypothetical protein